MDRKIWEHYINKFNENDEELTIQMISNSQAAKWIEEEVPVFECSDSLLEEIYYFRWWVFRKHIKKTKNQRIITEFLPAVPWAGPYNSINCANGHHIAEARWLKHDRKLVPEYIEFWLKGEGNERSYSTWIADAVYQYALVSGDKDTAINMLPELVVCYEKIEETNMTAYGLFWSDDDRDAMELSISGRGMRPTLNSYMYGNANAIASIAAWCNETEIQKTYQRKAQLLKEKILKMLWDPKDGFFKVIPQSEKDAQVQTMFDQIEPEHNVKEELGYIPWAFSIPSSQQNIAWKYLKQEDCFSSPAGITTAQRNHPRYMNADSPHECQWNGPVWPFATTQTLNSMISLLQSGETEEVTKQDFLEQLRIYAQSHYRVNEEGKTVNWLDENIDPESKVWLSREILKRLGWPERKGGYERGKDYNHSAFADLIIRGLCGVCAGEENEIILNPLLKEGMMRYFRIEDLPYKNHRLTISYDEEGIRYGNGKGLSLEVDGKILFCQRKLERIKISLTKN